ncbi:FecCD family ABC transporter permease [Sedimentisphaera salicampi]|uniref:Hemin transport system permease protein HmuU n=1 Tax=Sedimentisphaera salicampi TaxID=1941349 RepID=A0A1W6LPX0_9BACT|nr:iron ABC transporter permease [Sedimentisphaera salicampi]ARN57819.1 Hemin transport system permease protein HmuU [Sedimentisphaera salicampi]OXU13987.1 Hemin transport system permease protein HmuU [Sedimentisphaera salicampi]
MLEIEHLSKKKLLLRIIIFSALLAGLILLCSLIGSKNLSAANIIGGIVSGETSENVDWLILFEIRLPRCLLAAIVGASLSIAGVVFQALLKNPLADPYILGISSGAGLGAVTAAITGFTFTWAGISGKGIMAFAFALITIWIVWTIGKRTGKNNMTGLLLAGVVVNSFFSAVIMFMITAVKSEDLHATLLWLMGNVRDVRPGNLSAGLIPLILSAAVLQGFAPKLNVITFGETDAKALGINTAGLRGICFACAAFVTAAAVSLSGLVGFAGLIVPHTVRLIFGPDHRQLLPLSALCGASFLVVSDTLARTVIAPQQLPAGIITAFAGAPVFVYLLLKSSKTRKIYG